MKWKNVLLKKKLKRGYMLVKKTIILDEGIKNKIRNLATNNTGVTENEIINRAIKEYFFNIELRRASELLEKNIIIFENEKFSIGEKYDIAIENLDSVYNILLKAYNEIANC